MEGIIKETNLWFLEGIYKNASFSHSCGIMFCSFLYYAQNFGIIVGVAGEMSGHGSHYTTLETLRKQQMPFFAE